MKRGKELLATIKGHDRSACPGCQKSLRSVAMVDIVYTFEPCECAVAKYRHLIETLWHRECFHRTTPRASAP
jgi:hypothetical protein